MGSLGLVACIVSDPRPFDLTHAQLQRLQNQAMAGDNNAAVRIAKYYRMDRQDDASAVKWLHLAARRGDPEAWHNLQVMSSLNESEVEILKARANRGDISSVEALYRYYEFALADHAEAARWLENAAELGSETAREELERLRQPLK
jgi:TPR repeat protein